MLLASFILESTIFKEHYCIVGLFNFILYRFLAVEFNGV